MKINTIDINKLNPAPYNPRKDLSPQDPEYQKLKKLIQEFDYVDPLVVNKDMTIVSGHQRHKILTELGYKKIKVSMVDLSPAKEKALNIALNNPSAQGEWDYPKLKDLIVDIDTGDIDIEITGFDADELKSIFDIGAGADLTGLPPEDIYDEQHGVIVICDGEKAQEKAFTDLSGQGYNCKVVVT